MNKHLALIPITVLTLLTVAGCATSQKGSGANKPSVTNSTTIASGSNTGNGAGGAQTSGGSTSTSQATYTREIALMKKKGYSVNSTSPNATVKTSSGDTLSAWLGVAGRDGHNQFVFFFLNGRYLGTDTAKPSVEITSAKAAGHGIAVTYPVYMEKDSFANPTGAPVTITYTWNGSKLVPNKPYPRQFQASGTAQPTATANQSFTTFSMISGNAGWATEKDSVWLTNDAGTHWKNVTPDALPHSKNLQIKIFGLNDKQAWIAVTNNSSVENPVVIFHTSNGGQSWSKEMFSGVGSPITLRFHNANSGWSALMQGAAAGSESETIYSTANGGNTWSKVGVANHNGGSLPFGGDKTGASFLDQRHGWATGFTPAGGHIYLYQTTDGGHTWNLQPVSVPSQLKNAEVTSYPPVFFNRQEGVLPVSDGESMLVYRTSNGGQTWVPGAMLQSTAKGHPIQHWSFPSFTNGFATDGSKVFQTMNGGQTWSSFTPNISLENISKLTFTSSSDGWALMNAGVLYRTTDGGHTWTRV